jgi:hypothetical protein
MLITYDGHISKENAAAISRGISYLAGKPCRSRHHGVFFYTTGNQALVEPEMEREIRVREYLIIWKLRLEKKELE